MNDVVLKATGLTKRFVEGRLDVTVLQGVDLQVNKGDTIAIVGASGSGKSTLLHLMGGLDAPTSGQVVLKGQDLSTLTPQVQGQLRNQYLGFVYQFHHLLPEFSALDNVAMPLWIRRMAPEQSAQIATQILTSVGLKDRLHHRPAELSGGERQRVLLARALAVQAKVLLMDEPLANLDPPHQADWLEVVHCLLMAGTTVVSVLHEITMALHADQMVVMAQGRVTHQGDCAEASTHRALEAVFDQRIAIHPLAGQWVALPCGASFK